jgi:hypothetical protein
MPTLAIKIRSADVAVAIRDVQRLCQELDPNLPSSTFVAQRHSATER